MGVCQLPDTPFEAASRTQQWQAAIVAAADGAGRGLLELHTPCGAGAGAQWGLSAGCRRFAQDTEAADLLLGVGTCSRHAWLPAYWIPGDGRRGVPQLHRRRLGHTPPEDAGE